MTLQPFSNQTPLNFWADKASLLAQQKTLQDGSSIPELTWNHTYSWSPYESARSGVETKDGGLAIVGTTSQQGIPPKRNFRFSKLNANGDILWSRTYGGEENDYGMSVIQTMDDGYALTGYTSSYGAGSADAWLIKTDAYGKVEWENTYGETNTDVANTLIQTADGGYALAGWTGSYGAGHVDAWLFKTDNKGVLQWSQTYGGPRWDEIEALIQTNDSGYVFVGVLAVGDSASPEELWVVKTDATGGIQWNQTYGSIWRDQAYSIIQSRDGGYTIAGSNVPDVTGFRGPDFWLVKTDAQGLVEWNYTYGGIEHERARSVVQTADGGYALLGETDSFGAGSFDFWLVKTDANGTAQWNQTYGGSNCERPNSLVQTSDGGLVLIGTTHPPEVYNYDYLVMKIGGKLKSDTLATSESSQLTFIIFGSPLILLVVSVSLLFWRRKNY